MQTTIVAADHDQWRPHSPQKSQDSGLMRYCYRLGLDRPNGQLLSKFRVRIERFSWFLGEASKDYEAPQVRDCNLTRGHGLSQEQRLSSALYVAWLTHMEHYFMACPSGPTLLIFISQTRSRLIIKCFLPVQLLSTSFRCVTVLRPALLNYPPHYPGSP